MVNLAYALGMKGDTGSAIQVCKPSALNPDPKAMDPSF